MTRSVALAAVFAPGLCVVLGALCARRRGYAAGVRDTRHHTGRAGLGGASARSCGPAVLAESTTYPVTSVRGPEVPWPAAGVARMPDGPSLVVPGGVPGGPDAARHTAEVAVYARTMFGAPPLARWADC